MIATQSYSNVRSQRNEMMTEKMSRKPKKGSKKEEEKQRQALLLQTRKSQAAA